MRIIVSTVGTSILTNGTAQELRSLLTTTTNDSEAQLLKSGRLPPIQEQLKIRRTDLFATGLEEARQRSAEINGLAALGVLDPHVQQQKAIHYLIHTDTYQGEQVAKLLAEWLESKVQTTCQLVSGSGLSTKNLIDFQAAMADLARWATQVLGPNRLKKVPITFNLTGGFKSVNGFLQALGSFYADEVVYLFESSPELLRIPRLPVELAPNHLFRNNLELFRRLAVFREIEYEECRELPETLILTDHSRASLSAWGEILWEKAKSGLYQEKLWPPILPKVSFSQAFKKKVSGLPPDRLSLINQRIDELCGHLTNKDSRPSPASLNFKKLSGNPVPGSTHEFYAWSDQDAQRAYGHFEDNTFIIDHLGKHL